MLVGTPPNWPAMSQAYPGDYEYEAATNLAHYIQHLPLQTRVVEYRAIVNTFAESVSRIRQFHWLPIHLIYTAQMVTIAETTAIIRCGRDPTEPHDALTDAEEALAQEIYYGMQERVRKDFGGISKHTWRNGTATLKAYLRAEIDGREEKRKVYGVEAALAAMVTAGYAALETMAGDLWVAAVNRHPSLATAFLKARPTKQIDAGSIFGQGFDLTHRMGTVLVQTRKAQFSSFYEIKDAYLDAFGKEIEENAFIDCESVTHAEKVRHLIAHRGGVIDAKFKDEMKGRPEYVALTVGDQITFSGPMVAQHLSACFGMATRIILAVDEWSVNASTS